MQHIEQAGRFVVPEGSPNHFVEHVRVPMMSMGTYSVPAGGQDDQPPHSEDEVYVVVAGRASFTSDGQTVAVGPGTTLFVPAYEEHRFHDVTEDLSVFVVFAPAYTGRSSSAGRRRGASG